MKIITIEIDEDNGVITTVEEVLRLLKGGYTSGIDPTWDIVED